VARNSACVNAKALLAVGGVHAVGIPEIGVQRAQAKYRDQER
jgi:hypothetical protein